MKRIIDINDDKYDLLALCVASGMGDWVYRTVANSIPLPKDRLISADALRKEVSSWGMNDYEPSDFTDEIDRAPTIIERE